MCSDQLVLLLEQGLALLTNKPLLGHDKLVEGSTVCHCCKEIEVLCILAAIQVKQDDHPLLFRDGFLGCKLIAIVFYFQCFYKMKELLQVRIREAVLELVLCTDTGNDLDVLSILKQLQHGP